MTQAGADALIRLDAVAAIDAMRKGEITAEDYARALLDRVSAMEQLNAFATVEPDLVLDAAREADKRRLAGAVPGALHGLPIPVKDNINTKLLPTSSGTEALLGFRPGADAEVLKPLFAQGAILMGKTNMDELSYGWSGGNCVIGRVRNPYDAGRIPGGSSGGSAAAVSAVMAPLAIGGDSLGSIRVPAALCGIAGLRPTLGRYPGAGTMSLTLGKFDQVGPLARSVRDLVLFDNAAAGDGPPLSPIALKGIRFGVAPDYFLNGIDPEVGRITLEAFDKLQAAGAILVKAELPGAARGALGIVLSVMCYETIQSISMYLADHDAGMSLDEVLARGCPEIQGVFRAALLPGAPKGVSREAYEKVLGELERLRSAVLGYFEDLRIDALVFPPVLAPAPLLGDNRKIDVGGQPTPVSVVMGRNTALGSCMGMAGLVLPAGLTAGGLPVGMEFDMLPGRDRALLALGFSVEKALGPIRGPNI